MLRPLLLAAALALALPRPAQARAGVFDLLASYGTPAPEAAPEALAPGPAPAPSPAPAPGPSPALGPPAACPPPGFDAVKDFNISEYIARPWYIQAQMPLIYQPESQLYCVRAKYEPLDPRNPLEGLKVRNYANEGGVNGPAKGTSGGSGVFSPTLTAEVPDPSRPAKLTVGFQVPLLNIQALPGPYWVIATGANPGSPAGAYDWAIVSGGEPKRRGEGGFCRTDSGLKVNGVGLWLFSRVPQDPANTQLMLKKLEELGLDASVLLPVQQAGCRYEGAD